MPNTQIAAAAILSALYAIVMMAVMIGSIVSIASQGFLSPAGFFLVCKFVMMLQFLNREETIL